MNSAFAASTSGTQVAVSSGLIDSLIQASLIVQLILLLLFGLSIACWAVGLAKWKQMKELTGENENFLNRFWKAGSLDALFEDLDHIRTGTLTRVFKAGYMELQKLANQAKPGENIQLSGIDNLERTLRKAIDNEIATMESRLGLLATTGSTGPFIGLLGTVWGIMNSFHKIGQTGSASLAVVAPGISEALFTTAIGLAAAIPAVVLYNHFTTRIRREEIVLNNFATDFLNIAKRNFFRE